MKINLIVNRPLFKDFSIALIKKKNYRKFSTFSAISRSAKFTQYWQTFLAEYIK